MLKKIGGIVKSLAISFFFSSFLIFVFFILFQDKINMAISLVNKMVIVENKSSKKEIKIDKIDKRLVTYPNWGEEWAKLKIKDINVDIPVFHGDTLDIIKNGAGHYSGSYFSGEGSSIILAAHNSPEHFYRLPELKIGSEIIVDAVYGTYKYRVYDTKIIKDTDEDNLPIQTDKEILMLYTCYPVDSLGFKDKRFVVYAELINEKVGDINEK